MPVSGSVAKSIVYHIAMTFAEIQNPSSGVSSLFAYFNNPAQEELKPLLPTAGITHRLQFIVVLLTVLIKKIGEIEYWLKQHSALAKHKRNQESANAAIAIEEWMNSLELGMGESDPNQGREISWIIEELF